MKYNQEKRTEHVSAKNFDAAVSLILIFALIALGLVAVLINIWAKNDRNEKALENAYEKSFFNMADSMNDLETKLSKLKVANTSSQRMQLANDIWKSTAMIEDNLAQLPIDHYSISNSSKFINQLGDYIYSLNRKLQKGGSYSEEDIQKIDNMFDRCKTLNDSIQTLSQKIMNQYRIIDHLDQEKLKNGDVKRGNLFEAGFEKINQESIEYPEMIYDGPFSDALSKKEYKALKNLKEISHEQGIQYIYDKLKDTADVKYLGKASGKIQAYEYSTTTKDGISRYIQLSVKGGLPITISTNNTKNENKLSEEQAKNFAQNWVKKLIGEDMKGVWISITNNTAYINLAPVINDTIIYPDLIKVKVSLTDGNLLGWEANAYLQNHIQRELAQPQISQEQAQQNISNRLKVNNVQLALIPKDWGEEVLAYEFYATHNDNIYIVYINAQTGEEENILMVINSPDRGNMLI
ncbi:MAG TPA: germination protein YpeB [Clostridia bacterium]